MYTINNRRRVDRTPYEQGKELETVKRYFKASEYDKVFYGKEKPLSYQKGKGKYRDEVKIELPYNQVENVIYLYTKEKGLLGRMKENKREHYTCLMRGDMLAVFDHDTQVTKIYNMQVNKQELLKEVNNSGQNLALLLNEYAEELRQKMLL